MNKNNVTFILHRPQLSENIGACARGIKNFGFNKLVLIEPKPLFPNDKIIATSVGAKDIIKKTKVYDNLENIIDQIDILIATSARIRNKNIKHIELKDLKKIIFRKRVGFLFGSEASGLTNNEITYTNYTLNISTDKNFRSLNLSHCLIIVAQYISSLLTKEKFKLKKTKKFKAASKKEILSMTNLCIKHLNQINFFKQKEKKPIMLENLRNIFYKMELSDKETRILSSVFASLGKKR